MPGDTFQKLLDFLDKCREHDLYFTLAQDRRETIRVDVRKPLELWEVEFFVDGHLEIEVLRSVQFDLEGEEALERLFIDGSEDTV